MLPTTPCLDQQLQTHPSNEVTVHWNLYPVISSQIESMANRLHRRTWTAQDLDLMSSTAGHISHNRMLATFTRVMFPVQVIRTIQMRARLNLDSRKWVCSMGTPIRLHWISGIGTIQHLMIPVGTLMVSPRNSNFKCSGYRKKSLLFRVCLAVVIVQHQGVSRRSFSREECTVQELLSIHQSACCNRQNYFLVCTTDCVLVPLFPC